MRQKDFRAAVAVAAMLLVVACGDARLDKLNIGMTKDAAVTAIGEPPHRDAPYLMAGKAWEVLMFARTPATDKDSIPWRKMSPVVLIDGKVVGWGWGWWGGASAKNGLPMP